MKSRSLKKEKNKEKQAFLDLLTIKRWNIFIKNLSLQIKKISYET